MCEASLLKICIEICVVKKRCTFLKEDNNFKFFFYFICNRDVFLVSVLLSVLFSSE